MDWIHEPLPVWLFIVWIMQMWLFRWRKNDRARALVAKRLQEIENRLDRLDGQLRDDW